jgi:hypothetical protein
MQSHSDQPDHGLLDLLKGRAEKMTEDRENLITAGEDDERPIRKWKRGDMHVNQMPDDPQGVLRVSVGGNVGFGYCVFRGPRQACLTLLRDALGALERQP